MGMAGKGDSRERDFQPEELAALAQAAEERGLEQDQVFELLGTTTYDIHLNDKAYWRNIPAAVWDYHLGGYQVIKKWLSYREKKVLCRDLKSDEARYVTEMVRRIAAIILMGPRLDDNYDRIKASTFDWQSHVGS